MGSEKGKLKLRLIVVISLFLMLLPTSFTVVGWAGVFPQETTSQITVPWASSAEADGYIKAGEWDDALEIDLSNATWEAYLYLKHDNKSLYVFLDHVSDTISHKESYDNCYVAIDVLSDGGNVTKEDDYLFHSSGHHISIGLGGGVTINGSQWDELWGHGSVPPWLEPKVAPFRNGKYEGSGPGAFGVTPNDLNNPHSIFEIKIPLKGWAIEDVNRTFGFCVAAGSPGTMNDFLAKVVWPDTAYGDYTGDFYTGGILEVGFEEQVGSFSPPSTWGTAMLSNVPPLDSEPDYWFYIIIVIVVVGIVAAVVLFLRKRR